MPTQSSGPISFLDIKNALGTSSPLSFNELYRGGSYVPDITPNNDIPTSGAIDMQEMYSTWGNKTLTFTITVGSTTASSKKGRFYGYGILNKGGSFGSISTNSFLTPSGPMTIDGFYYSTNTHAWHLNLSSVSAPANSDLAFRNISISGFPFSGVRSSATTTQVVNNTRRWNWVVKSTAHPTSGVVTCTLNYYG
jgi:hypothetical protein